MKYGVYAIDPDVTPRMHRIAAFALLVEGGAYIFYDARPTEPVAVYPVRSFYVKKEG